jgi:hypothetical protein
MGLPRGFRIHHVYPSRRLLKIEIDAGGVRSRLVIDRLLVKEAEVMS